MITRKIGRKGQKVIGITALKEPPIVSNSLEELFRIKCGRCFHDAPVSEWCRVKRVALPTNEFQCPNCGYAFTRKAKQNRKPWEPFVELHQITTR